MPAGFQVYLKLILLHHSGSGVSAAQNLFGPQGVRQNRLAVWSMPICVSLKAKHPLPDGFLPAAPPGFRHRLYRGNNLCPVQDFNELSIFSKKEIHQSTLKRKKNNNSIICKRLFPCRKRFLRLNAAGGGVSVCHRKKQLAGIKGPTDTQRPGSRWKCFCGGASLKILGRPVISGVCAEQLLWSTAISVSNYQAELLLQPTNQGARPDHPRLSAL